MGVTRINLDISLSLRPNKMIEKKQTGGASKAITKTSQSPLITVNLRPNIPVNDNDIQNEESSYENKKQIGNFAKNSNMSLPKKIALRQPHKLGDENIDINGTTKINDLNKICAKSTSIKHSKNEEGMINKFENLSLKKDIKKKEFLKKLFDILKKYKKDANSENIRNNSNRQGIVYTARGPIKSSHKERSTPYGVPDLTVSAHHGGGVVFLEQSSRETINESVDNLQKLYQEIQVLLADKDFMDYFLNLSEDEINLIATDENEAQLMNTDATSTQQYIMTTGVNIVPALTSLSPPQLSPPQTFSPDHMRSSYTQLSVSPATSPNHSEPHDSSYETGSPGSSVVTSPGSPCHMYSPSRNSHFLESDQELSPGSVFEQQHYVEPVRLVPEQKAQVVPCRSKGELTLMPLGKTIHCDPRPAEQQLYELAKSAAWERHYLVQLVHVAIATKNNPNNSVEGFKENLMKTMKTQLEKKYENIGLLAVFAHLEFLKAPGRVKEYKPALQVKDEKKYSLLYIAAVERKNRLLARYVAEITAQVGYNPLEADPNGNTVLHVLASLGDSHIEVLADLLVAIDTKTGKKLFDVGKTLNKHNQSPLYFAVISPLPHTTTVVHLLDNGADPLLRDNFLQTPLQYHIRESAKRMAGGCVLSSDLALTRKLLQEAPSHCLESAKKLMETICSDSDTPSAIRDLIKKCFPEKH